MEITPDAVREERRRLREAADRVVPLVNAVRADLGGAFGVSVATVDREQYRTAVDETFASGDRAANVAALAGLLRDLDVEGDYPGFVVDELLGRELAATIAGEQPDRLLAEATFHHADLLADAPDEDAGPAGADDLDAALAAGYQTVLPGWEWRDSPSPFAVD